MMTPKTVAVIGLGLMGSALARAFANAGYELTVWNRTPEKARPFAGRAHIADSVRDACASSACVVVSLLDYGASDDVMHRADVEKALPGKLLVQLTTGTPNEARHGEAWARRHDIGYLDGAIMGYPRSIGAERMTILYAGPKAIFDENVALLRVLGGNAVYCGEPIGAAAALDLALLDLFFGVSAALLHGAALCAAESVPLNEFFGRVPAWLSGVPAAAIEGVGTGTYPHGNSTMVTNAAAIRHIVRGSEGAGIDASFPSALLGWFTRAIDRGHREDDIPSLYEAFRRP